MRHLTTTRSWTYALCLLLLALLAAPGTSAQDPKSGERIGEVAMVHKVVIGTKPGEPSVQLANNDDLVLDHRVETRAGANALLSFEPKGGIQLRPNSGVTLDRATYRRETGAIDLTIFQHIGILLGILDDPSGGRLDIETPAATAGLRSTAVVVEVTPQGDTVVWALEAVGDDLTVTSKAGGTVVLTSGYMTTVARGAAPTPPVPFDPDTGVTASIALPPIPPPPPDVLITGPLVPPEGENLPVDRGLEDLPDYVLQ